MKTQPNKITICYLECVVMPNGEIISLGKTIGWYKDFQTQLFEKEYVKSGSERE